MKLTPRAAAFGPWTISKLEALRACPRQFFLRRTLSAEAYTRVASNNRVGIAAHQVIEDVCARRLPLKDALERAQATLSTVEVRELTRLRPAIQRTLDALQQGQAAGQVEVLRFEHKLAVNGEGVPVAYTSPEAVVRVVIDVLGGMGRSRGLLVLDHKSGRVTRAEDKQAQLRLYAALAVAHDVRLPDNAAVHMGVNSLENPEKDQLLWLPRATVGEVRERYLAQFIEDVNEAVDRLYAECAPPVAEALHQITAQRPGPVQQIPARFRRGMPCDYCAVSAQCAAFKPKKSRRSRKEVSSGTV